MTRNAAERYNARMAKIFETAKGETRGLIGDSKLDGYGVNSPAMKASSPINEDSPR